MKKVLSALCIFFFPSLIHASLQDPLVIQEKTYSIHITTTIAVNTTSYFDLISLSSTASLFPHTVNGPTDIGEIDITHFNVLIDKLAASSTTFKVGVCTFVNPSTASLTYFFTRSSQRNVSNTDVVALPNFSPAAYRCKVKPIAGTDGTTPYLLSNDKEAGTVLVNSTATFQSSNGAMSVRTGDIVLKLINFDFTNTITYIIDVFYRAEP